MAAKKKKKKKTDWTKIETEYVTTNIGQRALAEKYGVSVTSINAHSRKGNWAEKKEKNLNEIQSVVEQETKKAIIDEKIEVNRKHIALYDKALGVADFLLNQYILTIYTGKRKCGYCGKEFKTTDVQKTKDIVYCCKECNRKARAIEDKKALEKKKALLKELAKGVENG